MRANTRWSVILIPAALVSVACGKSPPLDNFGGQAAGTICDKVYECCMPMELVEHADYKDGRKACDQKSEKNLEFWAAIIEKEQEKGRLTYDAAQARRCLTAFAAATCEAHKRNERLDGCDQFVVPRTPPGGTCGANESCMGGSCIGLSAESEGVCRPFVGEGESCAEAGCGSGLYCAGDKICKRKRPSGERCNLHLECESAGCNGRNPDAGTPGTCGLKGGEESRCFVTTGCSYGSGGSRGGGGLALLVLVASVVRQKRRRIPTRTE